MIRLQRTAFLPGLILLMSVAACGGGDDATLGGTISGLPTGTSAVLQNNGSSDLTVSANGPFLFAGSQATGATYSVTVLTQPVGAVCAVSNAAGTIDAAGSDVSSVNVTCTLNASIAGTVTGLGSGTSVTLSNGGVSLAIASNGAFAFPGILAVGTSYNVTVGTQPVGQTCTVSGGAGSVVANTPAAVVVTCV